MTTAYQPFDTTVGTHLTKDADANATSVQLGADGAIWIHQVRIDASLNPKEDVYLRFWDDVAAGTDHTNGSDAADAWLYCKRGAVQEYHFTFPMKFITGCFYAAGQDAGGTSGATNPSGTVKVYFVTSTS